MFVKIDLVLGTTCYFAVYYMENGITAIPGQKIEQIESCRLAHATYVCDKHCGQILVTRWLPPLTKSISMQESFSILYFRSLRFSKKVEPGSTFASY